MIFVFSLLIKMFHGLGSALQSACIWIHAVSILVYILAPHTLSPADIRHNPLPRILRCCRHSSCPVSKHFQDVFWKYDSLFIKIPDMFPQFFKNVLPSLVLHGKMQVSHFQSKSIHLHSLDQIPSSFMKLWDYICIYTPLVPGTELLRPFKFLNNKNTRSILL